MSTEEDTKVVNGRVFKRAVVKPDKYGIITVQDGWIGEEVDEKGNWYGWVPVK